MRESLSRITYHASYESGMIEKFRISRLTFQRDGLIMRKRSLQEEPFMKLLVFVTEDHVADPTVDALIEQGFRVTRLASTGGFLRKGNTTLLVGIDEAAVERAITIVRGT